MTDLELCIHRETCPDRSRCNLRGYVRSREHKYNGKIIKLLKCYSYIPEKDEIKLWRTEYNEVRREE